EGGEVGGAQRHAHGVAHVAACLLHDGRGVTFERVTEGVVGGDEEPFLAAVVHHGGTRAAGQGGGVVGPVHGVGAALCIGQVGGCGAHDDERLLLLGSHTGHGQRGAGVGAADQHVDLLLIEPLAGARGGNVGLVLVVGNEELDLLAVDLAPHVLDGHPDGIATGLAVDVGVDARHVGDETNANHIIGNACGKG